MTTPAAPAPLTDPATNGGRMVRLGRTSDYECSRTTTRLALARTVLADNGHVPTTVHGTKTAWDWATNRETHLCGNDQGCVTTWSGDPRPEDFDAAYAIACEEVAQRKARMFG